MTKAVAMELSPRGIRMASIHPGFVLTHLVTVEGVSPYAVRASLGALSERLAPLGRAGRPEDILRLGLAERLSS